MEYLSAALNALAAYNEQLLLLRARYCRNIQQYQSAPPILNHWLRAHFRR